MAAGIGGRTTIRQLSDGGDCFLDCLASPKAKRIRRKVTGPLGKAVWAEFAVERDGIAIIESARACGLALVDPDDLDPLTATSFGVGQLISAAEESGATVILIGLGGSATNDAGMGCLRALGFQFLDSRGHELETAGDLRRLTHVEPGPRLQAQIVVACDVTNPLLGPEGAIAVFGRQKGVGDARTRRRLEEGLAAIAEAEGARSKSPNAPMTGAAGGMAYGLARFLGARLVLGSKFVLEAVDFDRLLSTHDLVVTGEGRLDGQTKDGKIVGEIIRRCRAAGKPCYAVVGSLGDGWESVARGLAAAPIVVAPSRSTSAGVAKAAAAVKPAR